jgi:hypothetical protein
MNILKAVFKATKYRPQQRNVVATVKNLIHANRGLEGGKTDGE